MRRRLSSVALVVIVLMMVTTVAAVAQTTTVPAVIPVPLPGATVITGSWDPRCEGMIVTVTDSDGIVIGTGIIDSEGDFVINLTRPLVAGEVITITSDCGPNHLVQPLSPVAPVPIPEAGTLLMLGTGLAGVAGYAGLRWRARK